MPTGAKLALALAGGLALIAMGWPLWVGRQPGEKVPAPQTVAPLGVDTMANPITAAESHPARFMTVGLFPSGPCWVALTVDGRRVMSRVMQPGEREVIEVRDAIEIEVGDAGAFAFSIDGRPGKSLGQSGQVMSVRITRETMERYLGATKRRPRSEALVPVRCPPYGALTESDLLRLITGQVSEQRLGQWIETCGVLVAVTPEVEERLRAAGASSATLAAIREASESRQRAVGQHIELREKLFESVMFTTGSGA